MLCLISSGALREHRKVYIDLMLPFNMKVDLYGHKVRYETWKKEVIDAGIEGLTEQNSATVKQFIFDMEVGSNISRASKKGPRSYSRLNSLRQRLIYLVKLLQKEDIVDLTKKHSSFFRLLEKKITRIITDMKTGGLKTLKGTNYMSYADYAKTFKAFWHWYMKVSRKKNMVIPDITEDLDTSREETKFVWLKKEELDKFRSYFDDDDQTLLLFLFDSLIRAPTELLSLKVHNVNQRGGEVWLNIPNEISKTFGRSFNLLYSGTMILNYIKRNNLKASDPLFSISPPVFNKKLQRIAYQIFGDSISEAGECYKKITLYDFRHSGAIHFRQLFQKTGQSLDSIRHRGGWTDFDMVNYYTKLLGLDGHITKEKLLLEEDKTKIEKELEDLRGKYDRLINVMKKLDSLAIQKVRR